MTLDTRNAGLPRCIALTQERRGHGVSTAAYYLGRVLAAQGLRVLLMDSTGRRERMQALLTRGPVKHMVPWMPPIVRPRELGALLDRARHETAGKADVLVLDADFALLEGAGKEELGLDYTVVMVEPTAGGQEAADRIAERLHDAPPPQGRVGVVFSRFDVSGLELPERTEKRGLPVIGSYPADYLLASGDAYSLKGGEPSFPHDTYLYAILRLGQRLIQLVPLEHGTPLLNVRPTTSENSSQSLP